MISIYVVTQDTEGDIINLYYILIENYTTVSHSEHVARLSQLDSSWVAAATTGPGLGLHTTANSPAWLGRCL